jgi:hypothetical protein
MQQTTRKSTFRAHWAWIVAVALAAALPYALKIAADHDLWWHVRSGQLILEEYALPATDPFSFTASEAAWTNHEWLSDVALASVYAQGGDRALSVLRTVLLVAVLAGLAALLWRRLPHPLFVLAGLLLATPLIQFFVNLRPHGSTYLFTVLLLWILEAGRQRPGLLWVVPPLMALWTNLHGGFVLGLGILTLVLAARWLGLDEDGSRPDAGERRRMLLVCAVGLLAPAINPYGLGLLTYLTRELGADHSLILEWGGIWSFADHRVHFLLLCALPILALALARRLRPFAPIALLGVSAVATWVHGRFLILLVIFSCLVTFSALATLLRRYPRLWHGTLLGRLRKPGWAWALCAIPLLAAVLQFSVDLGKKGLRLQIDPWTVPVEACEFLRRHDLGPNLLLRFDWGGYAIWHLYPQYKVSGDGRNLTVYDADFVDGLLRAYDDGRFTDYTHRYDVDVILSEAAGPTYRELRSHDAWVPVHHDRVAAVFVRPDVARSLARRTVVPLAVQPAAERFYFP